jgi:dienelactone hydrolase
MRFLFSLIVGVAFTCAVNAQTPASVGAAALARATVEQLAKRDYAAVTAQFDAAMRAGLPEDKLKGAWEGVQSQFGAFRRAGEPRLSSKGDFQIVLMNVEFERASLDLQLAVNAQGQIAGLAFRPPAPTTPFTDASYVNTANFSERDLTVDAGGWPLPATLTIPNGDGPFPAVVLVHGSGTHDRDETLGPNKPFRDLARGLGSRGVAVLRYEKRTRQHSAKIRPLTQFTVKEETADDAVAAVRLLRTTAGIDAKRVFVLGHSLGGMVAPRIAQAAPGDIAGLIIMAGAVRSLEQSLIDQTRYLALADGTISPDEQAQLEQLQQLAAAVKNLKPGDPPPSLPGVSAPTSYWIDLRDYDAPGSARTVQAPMLILQGGRDYQVTVDDFARWKDALASRKNATLKLYPSLNHLFITGTGKSLPAEYFAPGHVDEQVVRDISDWVVSLRAAAR